MLAASAVLWSACGGSKAAPAVAKARSSAPAPAENATAEQVAKEMRGNVTCPARIATPVPPAGSPVADIVGVRPGLTYEEAANLVMCDNPMLVVEADTGGGIQINTYGQKIRPGFHAQFAKPRVAKTSKEILEEMRFSNQARTANSAGEPPKPGSVEYSVGTVGMPGQERVVFAARKEWFGGGNAPTVEMTAQALIAKYGPAAEQRDHETERYFRWVYDPAGRLVTAQSPAYTQCYGSAEQGGAFSISADCGVVVTAQVARLPENGGLARYLQVGVVDQAAAYRSITSTEEQLRQLDAARKEQELKKAAQTATKPKM